MFLEAQEELPDLVDADQGFQGISHIGKCREYIECLIGKDVSVRQKKDTRSAAAV